MNIIMKMINRSMILSVAVSVLLVACGRSYNTELYQEIKSVDKMVFATMSITKVPRLVDRGDLWKLEWGKRIAAYSYNTYLRAYIDLSELQKDDLIFDEKAKTVEVMLPPVVTEIAGRDMEMKKIYENFTGMRSLKISEEELAAMKEKANASLLEELDRNPMFKKQLVDEAKHKARRYFEEIFLDNGYAASIDFKAE